ncbi:Mitochondrial inner membrane protease ATP23 homolog [Seminavis robusta]|uniref:Mitochondrial inner membrane protease ATP23 n=1 Tax=Seminavis robusta TaxID=568900 RepID=A0A9N8HC51_9STRA|nr:Mitochondrial inner membrane protease ATP23 homolog [Seminavis robusta]|eukprot:Sro206_g086670.1 Mitochondrial inner membrane protease ATP23 homolog (314) ;mRNA; r:71432-72373
MTDGQATAKATSVASNNGNNKPVMDASCRSCVRLVREILQNPTSRPRQVLEAFAGGMQQQQHKQEEQHPSFSLKPIDEGVQVDLRVPDEPWSLLKRWNRIAPPPQEETSRSGGLTFPAPVLATSSSLSNTTTPIRYTTETIRIECRPCEETGPEQGARALIMGPNPLSIIACTNRLAVHDRAEMSEVLVHELVHAYDVRRLRLDFSDCESTAYSEVRAAREAECYTGSKWAPTLLQEFCVKQRAIAATNNVFPTWGRKCVRSVFADAYKDPRPFSQDDLRQYVLRSNDSIPEGNNHSSNHQRQYYQAVGGSDK